MTDESSSDTGAETRETITVEVPLDDVIAEAERQLRDAGFDTNQLARAAAAPAIDNHLLEAFQQSKYSQE